MQALEDVHLPHRPILQDILYYMDRIFTVIFFLEMLIKWLALGFKEYFHNAWCWLDFVIVMVSIGLRSLSNLYTPTQLHSHQLPKRNPTIFWIHKNCWMCACVQAKDSRSSFIGPSSDQWSHNLSLLTHANRVFPTQTTNKTIDTHETPNLRAQLSLINLAAIMVGAADIPAFRSMRTLRALRPLRAVSRWEGMRVSSLSKVRQTWRTDDDVCVCVSLRCRIHVFVSSLVVSMSRVQIYAVWGRE